MLMQEVQLLLLHYLWGVLLQTLLRSGRYYRPEKTCYNSSFFLKYYFKDVKRQNSGGRDGCTEPFVYPADFLRWIRTVLLPNSRGFSCAVPAPPHGGCNAGCSRLLEQLGLQVATQTFPWSLLWYMYVPNLKIYPSILALTSGRKWVRNSELYTYLLNWESKILNLHADWCIVF